MFSLISLIRKNRVQAKRESFHIAACSFSRLKNMKIKISGHDNFLKVGKNCKLQNCEIRVRGKENTIIIEDDVVFKSGKIYLIGGEKQKIVIGKGTTVEGAYFLVDENASIYVGEDCMLATDILIRTGDKHSIIDSVTGERLNYSEDVVLGKHVWVGRSAHILKGSVVSDNSIVGARTLVNKKFEDENIIIAGAPGKVVRRGVSWLRELI